MNLRSSSQGAALAVAFLLGGCGDPAPPQTPSRPAPTTRGERETIDPAVEARVRQRRLAPRATPLELGATAPQVEGAPLGKPAVLVFYRGHWWPWCRKQLGELQDELDAFHAAGASLVAVSNDAPEDRDALVKQLGLAFPVVSDTDLAVSAAFGVRQEDKEAPLPSIYVLDARGLVAWNAVGDNIVERPSVARILEAIPRTK